jgi:predicted alpha/beta superfamily hydrolase
MTKLALRSALIFTVLIFAHIFPSQAIQATGARTDSAQILTIYKFSIPQLKRQRTILVYLPKGYTSSKKRYPVIYMQDGQNLFKGNAISKDTWSIDSILNTYPDNKQCIIVGINNSAKYRMTEYNPYNSTYGNGEGAAFTKFLVETLKPYIDMNYRTKSDARHTAIMGSSMGGLLVMYAAYKYPETFGNAGVFSPSFWLSPEIYTEIGSGPINKSTGFYFTCGDIEGNEPGYVNKMDSLLHAKGLSLKQVPATIINTGGKHNEQQWRAAFPVFYNWVLKRF